MVMSKVRYRITMAVLSFIAAMCFLFAIIGPILWPDLGREPATVTVTHPGGYCGP